MSAPVLVPLAVTTLWCLYAYLGPQPAPGPLTAEAGTRERQLLGGKAVWGLGLAVASLAVSFSAGLRPAQLLAAESGLAWMAALGLAVPLLGVVWASAGSAAHQQRYPELRVRDWPRSRRLRSAVSWAVYLAGYELLFRGAAFLALVGHVGTLEAGAISTALYVLAHLRKDAGETFSCLLLGPVFCWLALEGGVGAAWLLHVLVAVGGEAISLARNPAVTRPGR